MHKAVAIFMLLAAPFAIADGLDQAPDVEELEWSLFSDVYPQLPRLGYPIEFDRNGKVSTDNLPMAKNWKLNSDRKLVLSGENDTPIHVFDWHADARLYVACDGNESGASPPLVLAERDTSYSQVTERLSELNLYRCPEMP